MKTIVAIALFLVPCTTFAQMRPGRTNAPIGTAKQHEDAKKKSFANAFNDSYKSMARSGYKTELEAKYNFLKYFNSHNSIRAMSPSKGAVKSELVGELSSGNFFFRAIDTVHGVRWWCKFEHGRCVDGDTYVIK